MRKKILIRRIQNGNLWKMASEKPKLDYQYESVVHDMNIADFFGKGNEPMRSPTFEGPKGTKWAIVVRLVFLDAQEKF